MTSEEQARAIADRHLPSEFANEIDARDSLLMDIAAALRTREAETWEQAAQECHDQARRYTHTANGWKTGSPLRSEMLARADAADALCNVLRARAAQPQEKASQ